MKTVRLTTAQALVRYLIAQRTALPGHNTLPGNTSNAPLFPGVYAIFGHGNVTSLGHALQEAGDALPTWRGQNEQGMALAAVGYAKAMRRRQIMVATTSIGPGALDMVTAAGVAHANRLPVLLLAGDTFASRIPDPVLQQVEHFGDPTVTVNDAFKPVVRYWDRIVRPEQLLHSLPHAVDVMLDPAICGPAFIALPQDVQAEAFDFPDAFFETTVRTISRPRADLGQLESAATLLRSAERPLIIAGGGVHYSGAEAALTSFAELHNIPVVETMSGKACLVASHPLNAGPVGVTGCESANALAAAADVVVAVGTRLQDFTTGSWTAFAADARFIGINAASFDAIKHRSLAVVGDAHDVLVELAPRLDQHRFPDEWTELARRETAGYHSYIDALAAPVPGETPTYAQVVGAIDRVALPTDYALTAAGGFPGELNNGWRAKALDTYDCEYGFSCMGYEISGAWGAKMAMPDREVISFVGDGSYLMLNSDLYSSVLSGHKLIVIVCDNGGYAVINRLQINQGGVPFNNQLEDTRHTNLVRVDFAAHAAAMGCITETVGSIDELTDAFERARAADRTVVIALQTDAYSWTEGGAFWEVGVPAVSNRPEVDAARHAMDAGKAAQKDGDLMTIEGRIYVVNGGTHGLGEATVRLLAERGAAGIAIVGRDSSKAETLAGELSTSATRVHPITADMHVADSPARVMAEVDREFGTVHGLVNIAASTGRGNVWDTDVELWDSMQAVNVRAPFFLIQSAARIMRREGVKGSIVNIGSVSGYGGQPFILAYSVSKGALMTLTKTTAYSLMRHGIRVNQLNLGWMDTAAEDIVQRRFHGATDGWLADAEAGQPFGRLIKPPEAAGMIAFMLSDESGMMTGSIVDYDQSVQGAGDAPKPSIEETPQ